MLSREGRVFGRGGVWCPCRSVNDGLPPRLGPHPTGEQGDSIFQPKRDALSSFESPENAAVLAVQRAK
jgi:hypothetical protein